MMCKFVFLAVGNGDSIIISPDKTLAVIVDMPRPAAVSNWLESEGVKTVAAVYLTHDHRDHFVPLEQLAQFLENWLAKHEHGIITLYLPTDRVRNMVRKANQQTPNHASERNRDALDRIIRWEKQNRLIVRRAERDKVPHLYGRLSFDVLHPTYLFYESHSQSNPLRVNETSLVLRAKFGNFVALLLADIEGRGITELVENSENTDLRANLVKIPHHGAWPDDGAALGKLLRGLGAELPVLSVGSKNRYGHVVPELFKLLLSLKESDGLGDFVCTEVTRTCINSIAERKSMGTCGLSERRLCGGDVTILADESGQWSMQFQAEHKKTVQQVRRAACDNRADL